MGKDLRALQKQIDDVQKSMSDAETQLSQLQSEVSTSDRTIEEMHDSDFVITVSTQENKVYARRNGQLVFEAICSTGSNSTLQAQGRTMIFRTPIGRFRRWYDVELETFRLVAPVVVD